MNQEILEYLNSAEPDFSAGFALFCRYSRNDALKNWISRKLDMPKLLYELEKLSRTTVSINPKESLDVARYAQSRPSPEPPAQDPVSVPVIEPSISFKTFDERKTRRADLPAELQAVYDECASDFKLRRGLHEKMKMATTNADRAIYRQRVIETDARIRAGFAEIDDYLTRQAEEKAKADYFKESTARSYVSRALKKDKLTGAQKATLKARVQALQAHGCTLDAKTISKLQALKIL